MQLVKAFQLEDHEATKYANRLKTKIKTTIEMNFLASLSGFTTAFIGGVGPLLVLWYGGNEFISGRISLGTIIAYNVFLDICTAPCRGS